MSPPQTTSKPFVDPFLRAVSIVVQGYMNRSPKKSGESLIYPTRDFVPIEINKRMSLYVSPELSERLDGPSKHAVYKLTPTFRMEPMLAVLYVPALGRWFTSENGKFFLGEDARRAPDEGSPFISEKNVEVSQKEVEDRLSTLYTRPYRVERVSDEALRIAERLIEGTP